MFLIGIHILIAIVLWIFCLIFRKKYFIDVLAGFAVVATVICCVHGAYIGIEHAIYKENLISWQTKRDAIVYELNEGVFIGDALVDFNEKVAIGQWMNESPWLNWYVNDSVNMVEVIPTE